MEDLARGQDGIVARWQAAALGVRRKRFRTAVAGWREPHDGVYVSGLGRVSTHQRLLIATLTTPDTALGDWSAAFLHGMRDHDRGAVTVLRPGSGGPHQVEASSISGAERGVLDLSVRRTIAVAEEDFVVVDGIKTTGPERTLLDLIGLMRSDAAADRLARDALRLGVVTPQGIRDVLRRNAGRRGCGRLRGFAEQYARLPLSDARSDAEAQALAVLADAGLPLPRVNVLAGGQEGDFVYVAERWLLELNSNQYHPFPSVDEAKQRRWEAAGWEVGNLPVTVGEDNPGLLVETVRNAISPEAVAARFRRFAARGLNGNLGPLPGAHD